MQNHYLSRVTECKLVDPPLACDSKCSNQSGETQIRTRNKPGNCVNSSNKSHFLVVALELSTIAVYQMVLRSLVLHLLAPHGNQAVSPQTLTSLHHPTPSPYSPSHHFVHLPEEYTPAIVPLHPFSWFPSPSHSPGVVLSQSWSRDLLASGGGTPAVQQSRRAGVPNPRQAQLGRLDLRVSSPSRCS
ncbi:hypothetical protein DL98DRAFT_52722 [Cadophora sp. DSE1049]|nr:hypothetical protein DL98DRAFT_52722 [Cadophora sp. DSE1049]